MRGYLEDLKVGGRPMTDKELADHYKHLYSELKKQKDDLVEYIKTHTENIDRGQYYEDYVETYDLLRMLGEIDDR